MDIQAMLNSMMDTHRRDRSRYHLTLGGLIDALEAVPDSTPVVFDNGKPVGEEDSYRGYYADLALAAGKSPITARQLLRRLRAAAGSTYEGYKGGDYTMGLDTPLWHASYGNTGPAIVGGSLIDGQFVLATKDVD